MPQITITGAAIRYNDVRQDKRSGTVFNRINFKANLTKALARQMSWGKVHDAGNEWSKTDLAGEPRLTKMSLTPGDGLESHAISFDALEARKFKAKHKDGEPVTLTLQIVTDAKVSGVIEEYLATVGDATGKLVLHPAKDQQMELGEAG